MNTPIKETKLTTLVLNSSFFPSHIISARWAFQRTYTGNVKPLDRNLTQFWGYDEWLRGGERGTNHPVLRSAHQEWPVPTVVLSRKPMNPKRSGPTTLYELVKKYKFTCQITGNVYRKNWRKHFTKEHVIPVAKGGPNEDWNLLPTCREANIKKSDTFPYFDFNGIDLTEKIKRTDYTSVYVREENMREEWASFPQIKIYE